MINTVAEYERLKRAIDEFQISKKTRAAIGVKEKLTLPQIPKFHLPMKASASKEIVVAEDADDC